MSQHIHSSMIKLLSGHGLDGDEFNICDYTIADQNSVGESQGVITSAICTNYKPVLGRNVTYVVVCVIINDSNEVLMIQEAKERCAGQWYLPAGRTEKGESIVQATVREVLEETGLECIPTTLLAVETAGGMWHRFVMTATVVGGELKTPAQADKESLQAKWFANLQEITLRCNDILPIIERAKAYKVNKNIGWHADILPAPIPRMKVLMRLIVVIKKRSTNKLHVLLSEKTALHYPTCEIHPLKGVHSTMRRFMVEMFGADVGQHRPIGVLSVEHEPSADGYCLTLLVAFRAPLEETPLIGKCVWQEIPKEIESKLLSIITNKNLSIELNVVR